ncbi:MAG: DUF58 domain-containing protein [Verrucomicrobiales bacterium]
MPTAPKSSSKASQFIDPKALMAVKNLELRARMVVEGFRRGLHRSPFHGFSVEFSEYRQYTVGDDPRYLDWRLYGRSDRYYIKKFEEETNLRCHLVVDQSRSMHFSSGSYTKADYGRTLAATFAYFLQLQSDAVGVFTFDDRLREYLPAKHRPGHLRHLLLALDKETPGNATDIVTPLKTITQTLKKRGLIVILSDFLTPVEPLEKAISQLVAARHDVAMFAISDPAEESFDFSQISLFKDLESGQEFYINPAEARGNYAKLRSEHLKCLTKICQENGVVLQQIKTNVPMEMALFDFLVMRQGFATGLRSRQG